MSRILNCECGFYTSFGHGSQMWDDPFYQYNPACPKCGKYMYGEEMEPKVTFEEFCKVALGDSPIMVMANLSSEQTKNGDDE